MLRMQDGHCAGVTQNRRGRSGQGARKHALEYGQDDTRNGRSQVIDLETVIGALERPYELWIASCIFFQ